VSRLIFQKQFIFLRYAPVILNSVKEIAAIFKQISLSVYIKLLFAIILGFIIEIDNKF
jgi:hypothetical protein